VLTLANADALADVQRFGIDSGVQA
jgi:hypothetical protein